METRHAVNNSLKVVLPLVLGGAILYWMYRDFDFRSIREVLLHGMDWTWMILSFPCGILAQMFRGWRWKQTLEPVGERPRTSTSVNSIFLSYAISLIVPRMGEFARCGILKRYDGVSFTKALGTVVAERAIDTIIVLAVTAVAFIMQVRVFGTFFTKTGTRFDDFIMRFSSTGWIVTATCGIAAISLIYIILRKMSIYNKVRETVSGIRQGVMSLRGIRNVPKFILYSIAIWAGYFLHYYLTFFCFDFTAGLGITCALVSFIVGSIAVIVPTPNGAGSWHFAVKTMLILYGVAEVQALYFVLIVHTVQTFLVILLGVYAWTALNFSKTDG